MSAARPLGDYTYQRHQPEHTVLYKIVQENLETFLKAVHEECGRPLPDFVEKEFREYLSCGILAHGFLRAKCESCNNEHLVAFSCKRRGFCPSCGGRRMSESAIHLVDEVLPIKPIRQWVISFPIQIRLLLAVRPKIMSEVLNIVTSTISGQLCKKAGFKKSQAKAGVVTLIQRITKLLEKKGIIKRDEDDFLQINLEEDDALARLQAGAATYRFTIGPNKGKKALALKTVQEFDHNSQTGLVAANSGFSLHAGVAMAGNERDKIEKLCRYIARPAVALERLQLNQRGEVVYVLKKPFSDGTTHIVMTQLELLEKLAAIVPRPRVHLTRFAGVFAPHFKHRAMVVPKSRADSPEPKIDDDPPANSRISWARLLKRVFGVDVESCHQCGGKMKIIAAIEDPPVIKKILEHIGLPSKPPMPWPARGPPQRADDDFQQFPNFDLT